MIGGVETNVLFDTGATHSFVSPELVGKGLFCLCSGDNSRLVRAAGGQIMHSLGLMTNIPVMIQEKNLPVDLIVLRLQNHDVILGMDWLGKYRATLDCHRGCVRLETGPHPIQYQSLNMSPALDRVVVSAIRAERMLRRGCEAYLTTITTMEHGRSDDQKYLSEDPLVSEFPDVFRLLQGVPP